MIQSRFLHTLLLIIDSDHDATTSTRCQAVDRGLESRRRQVTMAPHRLYRVRPSIIPEEVMFKIIVVFYHYHVWIIAKVYSKA